MREADFLDMTSDGKPKVMLNMVRYQKISTRFYHLGT
jgi:hypothetical protein